MASIAKPVLLAVIGILAVVLFLQTSNVITGAVGGTESTPASITGQVNTQNTGVVVYADSDCGTFTTTPTACATDAANPVCTVTIHDDDGWKNVSAVHGYLNSASGAICTADPNSCIVNTSCVNTSTTNITDAVWTCTFGKMWWGTDNGTWNFYVNASDGSSTDDATNTETRDALNAIDVPTATLNWGTLSVGGSAELQELVANCGNIEQDLQVNGSTMTCNINGNIAPGNITYGKSAAPTTKLTGSYVTIEADIGVASSTAGNTTQNTYWNITVPSGASGLCTGYIHFIATKNQTTT